MAATQIINIAAVPKMGISTKKTPPWEKAIPEITPSRSAAVVATPHYSLLAT